MFILITVIKSLLIALPLIIAVAYFTLVERKIMAGIQRRRGPDVVGAWGLIQPFADAAKLILKETILPSTANTVLFVIAPILSFMLSLVGWAVIPFGETFVLADINVGVLYLFAVSSLGVYGIIMSGWASNSKYAFLGGLRSAAQMVSYEVSIGFILIAVIHLCRFIKPNYNCYVTTNSMVLFTLIPNVLYVLYFCVSRNKPTPF